MTLASLLPALEAVYERDQKRLKAVADRKAQLLARIDELSSVATGGQDIPSNVEIMHRTEKHRQWRCAEVVRLQRQIDDLTPELDAAMADLKASFGKLEAARAVVRNGHRPKGLAERYP